MNCEICGCPWDVKDKKLKKVSLEWYCADRATEIPFSELSKKVFKDFPYSTTTPQTSQNLKESSKKILKNEVSF